MSTYTQDLSDEQETEFLRTQLEMVEQKKSLKKRNDELEDKKIKILEEIKLIEAEQQSIQEETERIEKEIQKNRAIRDKINRNEKKRLAKESMPDSDDDISIRDKINRNEKKRLFSIPTDSDDDDITVLGGKQKIDRTPQGMGIEVGDEVVMTLSGQTRRLTCLSVEGRGSFQYLTTIYQTGSPINKAFQELVVECGFRAQSRSPWTGYTSLYRDNIFVKKL